MDMTPSQKAKITRQKHREAQISQQSLFDYAPKAKVTEDYRAFIEELLEQEKERS